MMAPMRLVVLASLLAVALLGCGSSEPTTAPTGSPATTLSPPAAATGTPEPPPGQSDADIQRAMTERRGFGLRSDEAWVRAVAANPLARIQMLDFPMLPQEEVEFQGRQQAFDRVTGMAQRYAAEHPDQFAGLFVDQVHRLVVVRFTGDVETHRAGILKLLPGGGPLDVRLARFSSADLEALAERITQDLDWFRSIDAAFTSAGLDEINNQVELGISTANAAAPGLILEHFGVPPEELSITSDGTGVQLQPRGKVRIRVTKADGSPPGPNEYMLAWEPDRPGAGAGDCGSEVGQGIPPNGRVELPCAPGGWTIKVQTPDAAGWHDIGSAHAVVPPGLAVDLAITIKP